MTYCPAPAAAREQGPGLKPYRGGGSRQKSAPAWGGSLRFPRLQAREARQAGPARRWTSRPAWRAAPAFWPLRHQTPPETPLRRPPTALARPLGQHSGLRWPRYASGCSWGLGIARHYAGGDLGGAVPWLLTALNGWVRLLGRQASSAPVRGDAPAHFLLPGRFGVGQACESAQGSNVPSEATSGPA